MKLLRGLPVAEKVYFSIETEWVSYGCPLIHLGILLLGDNPASHSYVSLKLKHAEELGFKTTLLHLPENTTEETLLSHIRKWNDDESMTGYIVQLPLPEHINSKHVFEAINPMKDVDGFHPLNNGRLFLNMDQKTFLLPATAEAVMKLLQYYKIDVRGKHVVVVGMGPIVGRPIVLELLSRDATVTLCHKHTEDLNMHIAQADILISATGQAHLVDTTIMKNNAVAIDVGFTKENKRIKGDIVPPEVTTTLSAFAPVPGGVGPLTVAMLMSNVWKAWLLQQE